MKKDINKFGIYSIKNTENNKCYIGSTTESFSIRWTCHKCNLRNNKHVNNHLQSSWNLYGEKSFEFTILEIVSGLTNILDREQYWIDQFDWDQLYNICPRAGNSLGRKHNDEVKARLKECNTGSLNPFYGKKHTPETLEKISDANRKRVWTEESRQKVSCKKLGMKMSLEARINMSQAQKGTLKPGTSRALSKECKLVSPDKQMHIFKSRIEAANHIGCDSSTLSNLYSGKIKTCKGWTLAG